MNLSERPLSGLALLPDVPTGTPVVVAGILPSPDAPEWAQRLRELGFIEGEPVCVMRRGQPGGEPLAVRVGVSTFALRRAEAACVQVRPTDEASR